MVEYSWNDFVFTGASQTFLDLSLANAGLICGDEGDIMDLVLKVKDDNNNLLLDKKLDNFQEIACPRMKRAKERIKKRQHYHSKHREL